MHRVIFALGLGMLGVVVSSLVVWQVVHSWHSFSSHWLFMPSCMLPIFGTLGGYSLAQKLTGGDAEWYMPNRLARIGYAVLAGSLAGLAGYVAFVITSRTWFADKIEPAASGFAYQFLHPSVLPTFYENSQHGSSMEQTWWMLAGIGFLISTWVTYSSLSHRWNPQ